MHGIMYADEIHAENTINFILFCLGLNSSWFVQLLFFLLSCDAIQTKQRERYVLRRRCIQFAFLSLQFVRGLHYAAHGTLLVPRTRLELGKRAFAVAAPAAWNSLPDDVRSAPTLDKFKQCLKTPSFYTVILLIAQSQLSCHELRSHFVCKAPL